MSDPLSLSALELAEHLRRRTFSSEELTRFFLSRIERHDSKLQSFVTVLHRRALRWARDKDAALRTTPSDQLPVFHGVPSALKDLVPMLGTPTRFGSRAWRYFISPFDAPSARLMKSGGFVILGKLATSEFGALPVTEPDIHPPTRNPWSLDHTPGGSSGGSGSAVAAGLVPIAHGSDGGGSVRIPAAFCHTFGFKPSLSLTGNLHGDINSLGLSVMGPLSHTVEDAAAMLDVFRRRPHCHVEVAHDTCLAATRRRPRRMRVRFSSTSPTGSAVEPRVAAAVDAVARVLEDLGHDVEPVEMVSGQLEEFLPLWQLQIGRVPALRPSVLQPVTRWLRDGGRSLDAGEVMRQKRALEKRVLDFFGDADLLLTPSVGGPPPRVGQHRSLDGEGAFRALSSLGAFTALFNVTGQPAASIPAGVDDGGLPFAVQLVGRQGRDDEVLSVCRHLEVVLAWSTRRSPFYTA